MVSQNPLISITVCVRDGIDWVDGCLEALKNHRLGLGDLKGLHCNCKSRWNVLVNQSKLRRNGSEPHGYRSGFTGGRHF